MTWLCLSQLGYFLMIEPEGSVRKAGLEPASLAIIYDDQYEYVSLLNYLAKR